MTAEFREDTVVSPRHSHDDEPRLRLRRSTEASLTVVNKHAMKD